MGAVLGVEDDRERLAPVALAAEQPVAELIVDRLAADALLGQPGGDRLLGVWRRLAVETHLAAGAVDARTVVDERLGERALVGEEGGAECLDVGLALQAG